MELNRWSPDFRTNGIECFGVVLTLESYYKKGRREGSDTETSLSRLEASVEEANVHCLYPSLDDNDLKEFMTVYDNKEVDTGEVECEVRLLTADLIREGLKFATNMEQHFLTHDPVKKHALKNFYVILCSRI
ncbi:hypothetical protein TNCV_3682421 [Trichonephila clavipes]|uniref:Uncharacterized protein n=1 Tax=Trichonephila clavipes TaxID=2585209 RepID=A0A8X6RHC5_TRICX|nr:hypothetical protein TNCV_3682421 [Trichonephila clavipes]